MQNKAIDFLRNNISCAFGMIEDLSMLYKQPTEKTGVCIDVVPNMLVNRYWLKEDFDISKMVISFCATCKDLDIESDCADYITYFFNVLVSDIVNMKKNVYSNKLMHNSVEVTYNRVIKVFPNIIPVDGNGLTLSMYNDFLYKLLCDFTEITNLGFSELSRIGDESFEGLDKNNLRITVNVINHLSKAVPFFNKTYLPNITLATPNHKRDGKDALLKCICLDTEFLEVPLVHIIKFEDNYRELGSIIATKWVNDCVNIYTSENGLLTTREAVFYTCIIIIDMFLSFRHEFDKIK